MKFFITQIIGGIGFIFFVFSLQQKKKNRILFLQIISFLFYSIQYYLLSAYSGMIFYIINMIRCIVVYYIGEKYRKLSISFAMALVLIGAIFTYKGAIDIFSIIACALGAIFTWQPDMKILRMGQIIVCLSWIIYDIFVSAYVSILSEITIIIASILKASLSLKYSIIIYGIDDETINFSYNLPKKINLIKKLKNKIIKGDTL